MILKERIERVYMALEGKDSPRGARTWFARKAGLAPRSVSRWFSGSRTFRGPAMGLLVQLEERAGLTSLKEDE